ncbi:MAG: dTDP-4-dehydrorhamnose reductase [Methanospirillum sp.]|nr:dTDP-4-dehydrorhamnose reductase [Methanospirillum sp.]
MVVEAIKAVNSPAIVILGANGMLGHALQEVFPRAKPLGHTAIDITDDASVRRIIRANQADIVINAAAYTDVDGCEEHEDLATAVNGHGPGIIASACADAGAVLVHYSTDYIFDGTRRNYREDDAPNPLSAYGRSKLLGEEVIRKNMQDYRIIRTSWLFGHYGKNFVDTILSLSAQITQVKVVNDQIGKPTYTVDLARKTPEVLSLEPGIYHITNDGVCSWYEFASAFIPNATPCSTAEFPRKAKRPMFSILENTKTFPLRHWREAVREYIQSKKAI